MDARTHIRVSSSPTPLTSSVSTVLEAGSTVSEATVVLVAGRHARRAASSCCSAATCSRSARLSSSSPHTPARAGSSRCSAGCRTAQISSAFCCARPMCAWAIAMCCVSSPPPADPGEDLGPPPGKPAILRDVTAAKAPRHRRTFLRRGNLEGPIYEGPTSLPARFHLAVCFKLTRPRGQRKIDVATGVPTARERRKDSRGMADPGGGDVEEAA
jgi:hypothetical protein